MLFEREFRISKKTIYAVRDWLVDAAMEYGITSERFFAKFILQEFLQNPNKHSVYNGKVKVGLEEKGDEVLLYITNLTKLTELDESHRMLYEDIPMGETVKVDFRRPAEETYDEEGLRGLFVACACCDEYGIGVTQELEKTPDGPLVRMTLSWQPSYELVS